MGELRNNIDQALADQMVDLAIDKGINLFDTADMYCNGESEQILGKALKSKRQDVVIATKCGFRTSDSITSSGLSYRYIIQAVENSLKRLDTDYIDLFQLHIPDPVTPLEETSRALDNVVKRGLVRYVGYCNYPAWKAQKLLSTQELEHRAKIISGQMYYSLLGRDIEAEVVPFLINNGLALMVWSPLASGFLTGKYTKENPIPEHSRRGKFDFPPVDVEFGYKLIAELKRIANKCDATVAQVALTWILSKSFVSTVIIGATTIEQLEDNLKAIDVMLEPEDLFALDKLTNPPVTYPLWMQAMGWDNKVQNALGFG